jgi:hypothetical protein
MRKALIVFMPTRKGRQFYITFLAEDAKTPIGSPRIVGDVEALERIVDKLHGNGAHARTCVYNWGQGSEWVHLSDEQCQFFGIK